MDGFSWATVFSTSMLVIDYCVKFIAIGVVPENRRPSSSSAWLLLILFVPLLGIPLFLLLGSPYVRGRRENIQREVNLRLEQGTAGIPDWPAEADLPQAFGSLVALNRNLTALPMVAGTKVGLGSDYEANIERMAQVVDQARDYVDVCIYIMAWDSTTDRFFRALENAAARGVTVRVLLDHLGSRKYAGFRDMQRRLTAAGIHWRLMLPFQPLRGRARRVDLRNHRKLMVVDGLVAFMGSQNMIDSSYGSARNAAMGRRWHDIMIELTGPVVASLEAVFATDWFAEAGEDLTIRAYDYEQRQSAGALAIGRRLQTGRSELPQDGDRTVNAVQIVPSGPGFRTEPNLRLFVSLIHLAQHRLRIVSPYFVPDESLLGAIITAAHRGVEVEMHVSARADQFMVEHAQSSYYQALLEAGVRIFRYPAPLVLHTKCFTVDDLCSVMGSSNMDMRSFGLNYEISLLAYGGDITMRLHELMDGYRKESTELTAEEWSRRSWARRWLDSAMRLTSALQ